MNFVRNFRTMSLVGFIFSYFIISSITIVDSVSEPSPKAAEHTLARTHIKRRNALEEDKFPDDFKFGVSTSAYQIEGAWNVSGKGESIWDYMTHENPSLIIDGKNADVACNSYNMFKKDIALAKSIGTKMYRISLSWPRILPTGYNTSVNEDGIRYYNELIDEMLANEIEPMVTIFHWDLPKPLQDLGGWTSPDLPDIFAAYARTVFQAFGNKVKYWATINEPSILCIFAYGSPLLIPGVNQSGVADYKCGHNILLAHAKTYHLYDKEFRDEQKGKIGIAQQFSWFDPINETSEEDIKAAENGYQWYNEWFLHPLLSETGDYPEIMKDRIANKSAAEGLDHSRLPSFTEEEINDIRGTLDFIGMNYYYVMKVRGLSSDTNETSFHNDAEMQILLNPQWEEDNDAKDTPWGLRNILNRFHRDYKIPEIYITENGYADEGDLIDTNRVIYHFHHLTEVLKGIENGIPIQGYLVWSLLDNFEWQNGYTVKFGVFSVDFDNDDRPRKSKLSTSFFTEVYTTGTIPDLDDFLNHTVTSDFITSLYS